MDLKHKVIITDEQFEEYKVIKEHYDKNHKELRVTLNFYKNLEERWEDYNEMGCGSHGEIFTTYYTLEQDISSELIETPLAGIVSKFKGQILEVDSNNKWVQNRYKNPLQKTVDTLNFKNKVLKGKEGDLVVEVNKLEKKVDTLENNIKKLPFFKKLRLLFGN